MNAEDLEKAKLAKKTQWELDKLAKKNKKDLQQPSPVLCCACNRPPAWNQWVKREPTDAERVAAQLDRFRRWTADGKIEQVHRYSSPLVTVTLDDGSKALAHMACARRKEA